MNAYDFDGTIYDGDSGIDFIKFMFCKKPLFMTKHLFKSSVVFAKYKMGKIEFKQMKEDLFSFVKNIDELNRFTSEFANKNKNKIKKYYGDTKKDDDLIISASLDFYLLPLCKEIGLNNVICTEYDVKNGKIINENCKGEEKVKRFEAVYGNDAVIENAYGDTKGDIPMLKRAQNGFMIKGQEVTIFEK